MNIEEIFISIKNRNITFKQRKSLCALSKHMMEYSDGTEDSFIFF